MKNTSAIIIFTCSLHHISLTDYPIKPQEFECAKISISLMSQQDHLPPQNFYTFENKLIIS
ncbi:MULTISPECIES: hypothetical protein [Elizabethkingia]|uniref:hypothetical protein n=1 Tax=Elizabethkingia TaxID=308865 RepID=UPI0016293B84|nr:MULTISPECIES: hypothetical protein [Elizabethkingia]MBG0514238.1 hypothetical protein [Elizabethkingia meningoseptica]MDE5489259.1 hypothetical protein [Elizabethkingia meningoseptica]MDX8576040.1 hypothetical protein [Elizabethkingia sp. HX WYD]